MSNSTAQLDEFTAQEWDDIYDMCDTPMADASNDDLCQRQIVRAMRIVRERRERVLRQDAEAIERVNAISQKRGSHDPFYVVLYRKTETEPWQEWASNCYLDGAENIAWRLRTQDGYLTRVVLVG